MLANKLIEKVPNPHYAKEQYQSFIKKKNRKSVKQLEIITYQSETFENLNIVDINSVTTERAKTLYKLSKTIGKSGTVGSNGSLYSDTKKVEKFLMQKKRKTITKQEHDFKVIQVLMILQF